MEDIRIIEALEMWIWRRMMSISWTEKITNKDRGAEEGG